MITMIKPWNFKSIQLKVVNLAKHANLPRTR